MEINLTDCVGGVLFNREIGDIGEWSEVEELMAEILHDKCEEDGAEFYFGSNEIKVYEFVITCDTSEYDELKDILPAEFDRFSGEMYVWRTQARGLHFV